jgi:uncharacterized ion transporter superfamily protein YfcC
VTTLAVSVGAAAVGSAFGPTNPFQTGIALRFAELPPLTQPVLRFSLLVVAVAVWMVWTLAMVSRDDVRPEQAPPDTAPATKRDVVLLVLAIAPFVPYVIGVIRWDWGFNELSATFLVAGFVIALVAGHTLSESAVVFLKAMEGLLAASLFVGVARGISVVLSDGRVMDTIVYGLATSLARAPGPLLMIPAQALLHVPLPTMSGQAVLTMPILAPLCDLLGISRDAAVIAYQTGAGLMDMITPTNGALLAMVLGARVGYDRWLRFAVPGAVLVAVVGVVGIVFAQ